ncbi:MAG: hypothetical protein AVDCRST_MAG39-360, partial [uncultured Sphingomonadaceae bacterium]
EPTRRHPPRPPRRGAPVVAAGARHVSRDLAGGPRDGLLRRGRGGIHGGGLRPARERASAGGPGAGRMDRRRFRWRPARLRPRRSLLAALPRRPAGRRRAEAAVPAARGAGERDRRGAVRRSHGLAGARRAAAGVAGRVVREPRGAALLRAGGVRQGGRARVSGGRHDRPRVRLPPRL